MSCWPLFQIGKVFFPCLFLISKAFQSCRRCEADFRIHGSILNILPINSNILRLAIFFPLKCYGFFNYLGCGYIPMNTLGNFSFLQHLEKKPAAAAKSFFFCVSFDICSIHIQFGPPTEMNLNSSLVVKLEFFRLKGNRY